MNSSDYRRPGDRLRGSRAGDRAATGMASRSGKLVASWWESNLRLSSRTMDNTASSLSVCIGNRSVSCIRIISFCIRDVSRAHPGNDFGRIRAESAGLTAHTVQAGIRRQLRERKTEQNNPVRARTLRPSPATVADAREERHPNGVRTITGRQPPMFPDPVRQTRFPSHKAPVPRRAPCLRYTSCPPRAETCRCVQVAEPPASCAR